MTGLKVQVFFFIANANNTANISIQDGATNGYDIFGDSGSYVSVPPGGWVLYYGADGLDDVGSSDKTIDLASSDADASYQVQIVAG